MGAQVLESDGGAHPIPLQAIRRDLGLTAQHLLLQKNGSELWWCLPEPGVVMFGPETGFPEMDWGPSGESCLALGHMPGPSAGVLFPLEKFFR